MRLYHVGFFVQGEDMDELEALLQTSEELELPELFVEILEKIISLKEEQ